MLDKVFVAYMPCIYNSAAWSRAMLRQAYQFAKHNLCPRPPGSNSRAQWHSLRAQGSSPKVLGSSCRAPGRSLRAVGSSPRALDSSLMQQRALPPCPAAGPETRLQDLAKRQLLVQSRQDSAQPLHSCSRQPCLPALQRGRRCNCKSRAKEMICSCKAGKTCAQLVRACTLWLD